MPSGSVIEYSGKRGKVFRLKYRDDAGKQTMETLGKAADGWTKRKAERELAKRLELVEKGWRKPAPLTFEAATAEWFAAAEIEKAWKPKTLVQYRVIVKRLNDTFGPMPLNALRPGNVADYKTAMLGRFGAATVCRDLSIMHSIFDWAVVTERAERNPCDGIHHPTKPRWRGQALRPEQVQMLLRGFDDEQARLAFLTLVLTGVRRSELVALRWDAVDLIENRLRVVTSKTKTGERSIALPPMLAEQLWQHRRTTAYRSDHDLVFCHPERGTVYRADTYKKALLRACEASGVAFPEGFRPMHDLRVTSITNGVRANENSVKLQARAGHSSFATTQAYIDLAGVAFHEEAAALADRMLGLSNEPSTRLTSPDVTSHDPASLNDAVSA